MNWIKKHGGDIVLTITSTIITLVLIDVALYFSPLKATIYRLNYPQYYFVDDVELGYDIAKNFPTSTHFFKDAAFPIWSNNLGCFDTDFSGETPYIYLGGDSLTWSFTPFEDTWGRRIEKLLGTRTIKCGVVGYGTKQELMKAKKIIGSFASPSLIIVGYTAYNDFSDDVNSPQNTSYNGYLVKDLAKNGVTEEQAQEKYANFTKYCSPVIPSNRTVARIRCFVTNRSVLFNLFKSDIRAKIDLLFPQLTQALEKQGVLAQQEGTPIEKTDAEYEKHLNNILDFKKFAEEKDARLLFVLAPYDNTRVIPFLEKENIPYVDLDPVFGTYSKATPLIWPKDGHYNIAGNHVVGLVVSKFIIENNLVKIADAQEQLQEIDKQLSNEFGNQE
ncbi:MAG: hypothetical protein U1D31_01165 [Patescibacteria group bacterium]|nr:hypothetical protein [bacterium]MDZ4240725.1 hypothetical protein [Patescibacteria group bacterium]